MSTKDVMSRSEMAFHALVFAATMYEANMCGDGDWPALLDGDVLDVSRQLWDKTKELVENARKLRALIDTRRLEGAYPQLRFDPEDE